MDSFGRKGTEVVAFSSSAALMNSFDGFGRDLNEDVPGWGSPYLPPVRQGEDRMHFLALVGKSVVGRVSAFLNRELLDGEGRPIGSLGLFESVEEYGVADALLSAGMEWLLKQGDVGRIWGPLNRDIWHGYRFMTRGFDARPFYGEPRNKPYYGPFFERFGFRPLQRWNSFEFDDHETVEELYRRGSDADRGLTEGGYSFGYFRKERFREELRELHSLMNAAFRRFLGFTLLSLHHFYKLYGSLDPNLLSRHFLFAFDEKGRPAGFIGGLPETGAESRGEDEAAGKGRFMLYVIGVTPEESMKAKGLGKALLRRILKRSCLSSSTDLLIALVAEGGRSRGLFRGCVPGRCREYTLYEAVPR